MRFVQVQLILPIVCEDRRELITSNLTSTSSNIIKRNQTSGRASKNGHLPGLTVSTYLRDDLAEKACGLRRWRITKYPSEQIINWSLFEHCHGPAA